jgi:hypothetical protein
VGTHNATKACGAMFQLVNLLDETIKAIHRYCNLF